MDARWCVGGRRPNQANAMWIVVLIGWVVVILSFQFAITLERCATLGAIPLLRLCCIKMKRRVRLAVIRQEKATIMWVGKELNSLVAALERAARHKLKGGRDYSLSPLYTRWCLSWQVLWTKTWWRCSSYLLIWRGSPWINFNNQKVVDNLFIVKCLQTVLKWGQGDGMGCGGDL